MSKSRISPFHWFLVFALALFMADAFSTWRQGEPIPYSEFTRLLSEKKVEDLTVSEKSIRGTMIESSGAKKPFFTNRVEPELARELENSGVKYQQVFEDSGIWLTLLYLLPFLILLPLMFRLFSGDRQKDSLGLLPFGRSHVKVYMESDTKVTFKDVAGVDEAKAELEEVVRFLKSPADYGKLGAHMPKGILLVGPPGTGKTLLARAVAGEAGVPFFTINGSEFVEMFVGVGAARVRDLFSQARAKSPCIIFIDELDALGRSRAAAGVMGGNDEKEQTLNQLLSELDGFDSREGVILLAATNRPEVLDPALLRAGRFDRQILVDRPDRKGRLEILKVHASHVSLASDTDLDAIAALSPGFTGADLANLINEAALVATRRGASNVGPDDFTQALERIIAGLEKRNRLLNPLERKVVAFHEMGHALVAAAFPTLEQVHKVSIIPRGIGSLGYTIQRPTEDRYLMTQQELENKMAVLLGGRASEELIFGHLSTGAADDIAKVTDIARAMVMTYGMESKLGPVAYTQKQIAMPTSRDGNFLGATQSFEHSEQTAREIDEAVRAFVSRALLRAQRVLKQNKALLEEGARLLIEKETLAATELEPLFGRISSTEGGSGTGPGSSERPSIPSRL